MWNSEQHRLRPKYEILRSSPLLVKKNHVTYSDDNNKPSKITYKHCNGFLRRYGKTGKLIYINFINSGIYTIGIYPEDINLWNLFFQCHVKNKMHHIYQRLFKEGNGDPKYLRCPDLWE